jgi:uncharacterized protein YggL (DUF469 family)
VAESRRPALYDYQRALSAHHHDATFRTLVDHMLAMMNELEYSPADLRAAVVFACIRFEERRHLTLVLSREEAERLGVWIEGEP